MASTLLGLAFLILAGLAVGGCYDTSPSSVVLATPGQYKGQTDPLVGKLKPGGELDQKLQARFRLAEGRD